jgi:hypothetical protein
MMHAIVAWDEYLRPRDPRTVRLTVAGDRDADAQMAQRGSIVAGQCCRNARHSPFRGGRRGRETAPRSASGAGLGRLRKPRASAGRRRPGRSACGGCSRSGILRRQGRPGTLLRGGVLLAPRLPGPVPRDPAREDESHHHEADHDRLEIAPFPTLRWLHGIPSHVDPRRLARPEPLTAQPPDRVRRSGPHRRSRMSSRSGAGAAPSARAGSAITCETARPFARRSCHRRGSGSRATR